MKKVFIIILIVTAGISSCKKEDKSVFDKSPDERLSEQLAAYQAQLTGAQNGWKGVITVDSGKGATYGFYFKFNDQNRVVMLSDFDSLSAVTPKESSYRLKALQQPSLIFDTYSYLHVLADPDETVNGGIRGAGLVSDFEFYFDSTAADTVKLAGRYHGSKMIFIKATPAEESSYNSGGLATGLDINKILTYFKRLTIGAQLYDIRNDPANRQLTFSWLDANGNLVDFSTAYYFTAGGIVFTKPPVNGTQIISAFNNMTWNPVTETINLTVNSVAATITGIVVPLKVDVTAPQRWWNYSVNQNDFWITQAGFHINGVDDALGLFTIPGYSGFTVFEAEFGVSGGSGFDLLSPIINDSLNFGAAFKPPVFRPDGRIVFPFFGILGTVPVSANAVFTAMRVKMSESTGYYFVQIDDSGLVYDMVSAGNGKAWIRWEW